MWMCLLYTEDTITYVLYFNKCNAHPITHWYTQVKHVEYMYVHAGIAQWCLPSPNLQLKWINTLIFLLWTVIEYRLLIWGKLTTNCEPNAVKVGCQQGLLVHFTNGRTADWAKMLSWHATWPSDVHCPIIHVPYWCLGTLCKHWNGLVIIK